jgi:hypothetical protein
MIQRWLRKYFVWTALQAVMKRSRTKLAENPAEPSTSKNAKEEGLLYRNVKKRKQTSSSEYEI